MREFVGNSYLRCTDSRMDALHSLPPASLGTVLLHQNLSPECGTCRKQCSQVMQPRGEAPCQLSWALKQTTPQALIIPTRGPNRRYSRTEQQAYQCGFVPTIQVEEQTCIELNEAYSITVDIAPLFFWPRAMLPQIWQK